MSRTPARPAVRTGCGRWIALGALSVGVALGVIGALPAVSTAAVMSAKLTGVRLVTESDVGLARAVRLPDLAAFFDPRTRVPFNPSPVRYSVTGSVSTSGRAMSWSISVTDTRSGQLVASDAGNAEGAATKAQAHSGKPR